MSHCDFYPTAHYIIIVKLLHCVSKIVLSVIRLKRGHVTRFRKSR